MKELTGQEMSTLIRGNGTGSAGDAPGNDHDS